MTHTPHELAEKFPEFKDKIHDLKMNNQHFSNLADEYHKANREVHRIETEVESASDVRAEELKKHRIKLLDEITAILHA